MSLKNKFLVLTLGSATMMTACDRVAQTAGTAATAPTVMVPQTEETVAAFHAKTDIAYENTVAKYEDAVFDYETTVLNREQALDVNRFETTDAETRAHLAAFLTAAYQADSLIGVTAVYKASYDMITANKNANTNHTSRAEKDSWSNGEKSLNAAWEKVSQMDKLHETLHHVFVAETGTLSGADQIAVNDIAAKTVAKCYKEERKNLKRDMPL